MSPSYVTINAIDNNFFPDFSWRNTCNFDGGYTKSCSIKSKKQKPEIEKEY